MKDRKSTPLTGLFFRELYLGKRSYISTTIVFAVFIVIIYIILLSFQYGLMKDASPEALKEPREALRFVAVCFPAVVFALNTISICELGNHDTDEKWTRFLYSSPLSEKKFFAVKFAIAFVIAVAGFGLSLVNAFIVCGAVGMPLTYTDVSIMAVLTVVVIFCTTVLTAGTFFFKNSTVAAAGFFLLVIVFAAVCFFTDSFFGMSIDELLVISDSSGEINPEFIEKITGLCESLCPFTPLILIAVLALGWGACVLITRNRERRAPLKGLFTRKSAKEG